MFKIIDWQLVAFVAGSLLQEYTPHLHIPKIYYWDTRTKKTDEEDKKIA
jgi:hypothetical protein